LKRHAGRTGGNFTAESPGRRRRSVSKRQGKKEPFGRLRIEWE